MSQRFSVLRIVRPKILEAELYFFPNPYFHRSLKEFWQSPEWPCEGRVKMYAAISQFSLREKLLTNYCSQLRFGARNWCVFRIPSGSSLTSKGFVFGLENYCQTFERTTSLNCQKVVLHSACTEKAYKLILYNGSYECKWMSSL